MQRVEENIQGMAEWKAKDAPGQSWQALWRLVAECEGNIDRIWLKSQKASRRKQRKGEATRKRKWEKGKRGKWNLNNREKTT